MLLTLKECIKSANNIYDIMVNFYRLIAVSDKENEMIEKFCEAIEKEEYSDLQKELGGLLNGFLQSSKFDNYLEYFKEELIDLIDEKNIYFVSIFLLYRFDKKLTVKEDYSILGFKKKVSSKKTSKIGPLNTEHMCEYGFYLNPVESMIRSSDVYVKRRFRLPDLSTSGIKSLLSNFQIIDKSPTSPTIKIDLYSNGNLFDENVRRFKIGIVPFSSIEWFDIDKKSYEKTDRHFFSIRNKEEFIDQINDAYINVLEKMEEEKVDIVIFPELSSNSDTIKVVRDFLINRSIYSDYTATKLVFMGSEWNEGINECTLLSGAGSIILQNKKSKTFILKDENEVKFYERLVGGDNNISFVDIPNFGRLSYRICKDALDAIEETKHWKEFEVAIEVVSSYTPSLSHFENTYQRMSKEYHGMNILANCCKERLKYESIGFISVPGITTEMPLHSKANLIHYNKTKECNDNCSFCNCSYLYEVDFDQESIKDGVCSFKVSQSKILR